MGGAGGDFCGFYWSGHGGGLEQVAEALYGAWAIVLVVLYLVWGRRQRIAASYRATIFFHISHMVVKNPLVRLCMVVLSRNVDLSLAVVVLLVLRLLWPALLSFPSVYVDSMVLSLSLLGLVTASCVPKYRNLFVSYLRTRSPILVFCPVKLLVPVVCCQLVVCLCELFSVPQIFCSVSPVVISATLVDQCVAEVGMVTYSPREAFQRYLSPSESGFAHAAVQESSWFFLPSFSESLVVVAVAQYVYLFNPFRRA